MDFRGLADRAGVAAALEEADYFPDEGIVNAVFLATRLGRPLFLEGAPGVGKTALAAALARVLGVEPIRLQCYEGLDAFQALYEWNVPRQLMHLRAAGDTVDRARVEDDLYTWDYLIERPVLRALTSSPSVLLVDEVDRADGEFEALLLEVLEDYSVSIPEWGTVRAADRPLVVLTSNQTREVHDALKRRCLYHWLDPPDADRELRIITNADRDIPAALAAGVVQFIRRVRQEGPRKPPGIAESIDLARAAHALGAGTLTAEVAEAALGTVTKNRDDRSLVRGLLSRIPWPLPDPAAA